MFYMEMKAFPTFHDKENGESALILIIIIWKYEEACIHISIDYITKEMHLASS